MSYTDLARGFLRSTNQLIRPMPQLDFDAETEIPSLAGKVILITGGTSGLGYETVLSLATHGPAHIFFTGRSHASADRLIEEAKQKSPNVPVTFLQTDLASLKSVQETSRTLLAQTDRLDILNANAGIMNVGPDVTEDGYEIQFGTNHMGHALLAKLLTPLLEKTAQTAGDARIIWNSSTAYNIALNKGIDFDTIHTNQADISWFMGGWMRYGQSKLANLLYARVFAKHHPTLTSVSVHPGVSATNLVTSMSLASRLLVYSTNVGTMLSPQQCALNQQWAATAPRGSGHRQVENGKYYHPVGKAVTLNYSAKDDGLADTLWEWTQNELKDYSLE